MHARSSEAPAATRNASAVLETPVVVRVSPETPVANTQARPQEAPAAMLEAPSIFEPPAMQEAPAAMREVPAMREALVMQSRPQDAPAAMRQAPPILEPRIMQEAPAALRESSVMFEAPSMRTRPQDAPATRRESPAMVEVPAMLTCSLEAPHASCEEPAPLDAAMLGAPANTTMVLAPTQVPAAAEACVGSVDDGTTVHTDEVDSEARTSNTVFVAGVGAMNTASDSNRPYLGNGSNRPLHYASCATLFPLPRPLSTLPDKNAQFSMIRPPSILRPSAP